ncbi:hypothetical protein MRB53_007880 [Persea americana]|uniref:Uncharacterized protein n=1 Tax=Persea americana TaxID=3435 RepID=A0ACC2MK86_PERAE|nr:hypothetical protein MRB53_007880 [Persea americana]
MARECMRLVFLLIFHLGLTYGSRRANLLMSHADMVVNPTAEEPSGLCESVVTPHGYPCKEYKVTTGDGYILSLHNIPRGRLEKGIEEGKRQPVLLQHGVLMDGMTWLLGNPDESLGYILADSGFDVWIGNTRGTQYSLNHQYLDPKKKAYWAWSWDELVEHELPAIVGFVHSQTGQKIHYVGHSLGTLVALASFSEGRLVDVLKSAALLCPIAYLSHMTTPIGQVAAKAFIGEIMSSLLGIPEFNPKTPVVADILTGLCKQSGFNCYDLLTSITGKNCCLNSSNVEFVLKFEPQPTSTKNMVHLAQMVRNGVLTKFDHGNPAMNMLHYAQFNPPVYNLSHIPNDLPLFLSYGGQDALSVVPDVQLLLDRLKFHDVGKLSVQFVEDFAHADFVMGVTAKSVVYNAIIAFFNHH